MALNDIDCPCSRLYARPRDGGEYQKGPGWVGVLRRKRKTGECHIYS